MKNFNLIFALIFASIFITHNSYSQSFKSSSSILKTKKHKVDNSQFDKVQQKSCTVFTKINSVAKIKTNYYSNQKGALLFNNGSLVNKPGSGPAGSDYSLVEVPLNSYGIGIQKLSGNRTADDFIVNAGNWTIDSIVFFAYQTGSATSPSTFTHLNFRIWSGQPGLPGSTIVYGDTSTNKMTTSYWSGIYRGNDTTDTQRPIMKIVCTDSIVLNGGIYWLDWQADGSGTSGPWQPSVTISGQPTTGDGIMYDGSTAIWQAINTTYGQGLPFEIYGTSAGAYIDAGISNFLSPIDTSCNLSANETVKIKIHNYGMDSISNFTVAYILNGQNPVTAIITDTIAPGADLDFSFPTTIDLSTYGNYNFIAYTDLLNDVDSLNDSLNFSIKSVDAVISLKLLTDIYSSETTWELIDKNTSLVYASGGGYSDTTLYFIDICVMSTQCFDFVIYDSYGDGILSPGGYEIYYNNVMVDSNYSFVSTSETVFNIGGGCPANNLGVEAVYTLGKLPMSSAIPHNVSAMIKNHGTVNQTNFSVYLNISGANTFIDTQIVSNLAPNATVEVSFADFAPTSLGNNNVKVFLDSDQDSINNEFSYFQTITNNTYSYSDTSQVINVLGFNSGSGLFLTKYYLNSHKMVKEVNAYISGSASVGEEIYAVVLDSNANVVGTSAKHIITAADKENYVSLIITNPPTFLNSYFYVGFHTNSGHSPLGLQQELPTRTGAFFAANTDGSNLIDLSTAGFSRAMIEGVVINPMTNDLGVLEIVSPQTACGLNTNEDISARIFNNGIDSVNAYYLSYSINSGVIITDTINSWILSGDTLTYTFAQKADFSTAGTYTIKVFVSLMGDANIMNDSLEFVINNIASSTMPYSMGFEQSDDLVGWKVINANNDENSWLWLANGANANTGTGYCYYSFSTTNNADDWIVSKCLEFEAGKTYQLGFYYKVAASLYPEKLKVMLGSSQEVMALTTQIVDLGSFINETYLQSLSTFTVPATGVYYLGWHAYSSANMWNLYVDDISISDVTGVEELDEISSLKIYPNPTTDLVNLVSDEKINSIKIYNSLGELIYDENPKSLFTTINIKYYKSGVYFFRIETDLKTSSKIIYKID
ncbi:MAG: T9SS type A sorting domain-containing protein [Saprospiraceae bacterium]|nr:T9SS type A sorting domain-containing protein [Saprospiraceae bacterium]